jgi:hypothetical protein
MQWGRSSRSHRCARFSMSAIMAIPLGDRVLLARANKSIWSRWCTFDRRSHALIAHTSVNVRLESYRTRDFQPSEPPKPTRRSTEQIRTGRPSLRFSRVLPTPEWSSAPDLAQNAGAWILAKHPNRLAKRSFRDTIACSLLHCLHKRGKKQALLLRGVTTPIASGSLEGGSEQLHLPRLKAGLDGPVRIRFRGVTGGPYNRSLSWAAPEHDHPYLGSGTTHFACGDSESEEVRTRTRAFRSATPDMGR